VGARVIMIAGFPPPLNGVARSSEAVLEALSQRGVDAQRLSITTDTLGHTKSLRYHAHRFIRCAAVLLELVKLRTPGATVYVAPAAGHGIYYSFVHILWASFLYHNVVLHHHTCQYVSEENWIIRALLRLCGTRLTHIFLSSGMAERFQERYGTVKFLVANNSALVRNEMCETQGSRTASFPDTPLRIGHLSNLCRDKGFFIVADLFERLIEDQQNVELYLAGPALEPRVRERIENLRTAHAGRVFYAGPLYGEEKSAFYRHLDVFVFPTQFRQEAQPHVIYEALAAGTCVLATPRGCIPEMLWGARGATSPTDDAYVEFAICTIADISHQAHDAHNRRAAILESLETEVAEAERQYERLYNLLGAPTRAQI